MVRIMRFRGGRVLGYPLLGLGIALSVHGIVTGWPPSVHPVPKSLLVGALITSVTANLIGVMERRRRRAIDREWFEQHR
jgi:hypothetical protein